MHVVGEAVEALAGLTAEAVPPVPEVPPEFARERPENVELCAVCQCANAEDHEHGPIVKPNCSHSFHRDCLQECMDAGDLTFEDACPVRCHLGLPDMPPVSQKEDHVSEQYFGVFGRDKSFQLC